MSDPEDRMFSANPYVEARETGYAAGIQGIDPRSNPYEKLSKEWQTWNRFHTLGVELATRLNDEERERLRKVYKA